MTTNMSLEDIILQLSKYGRPDINQFAVSASGTKAAGVWGCEVWIPSRDRTKDTPEHIAVTGRRMIGRGGLREAAETCLMQCEALAEGADARWYKFVSEDEARQVEKDKS